MQRRAVILTALLAVLGLQVGLTAPAVGAPGDAVMRTTKASKLASEVLTVDVLDNVDPPAGTTWDVSSVCLLNQDGCVKLAGSAGFARLVNDDGTITSYQPSRYGGVGGVYYSVRDSAGGVHTAFLDITEKLVSPARVGDPDPAVRSRLRVTNVVSPTTFDHAGQRLRWTSVVTNTGNVALERFFVTDSSPYVSGRSCAPVAQGATLAPGASTTCTGTLSVWQDFIDERADRIDTVTAFGKATVGTVTYKASASATATSLPVQTPRLGLTASTGAATGSGAGRTVPYAFVVTNRGNTTLQDLIVRAPFPGLAALVCSPVPLGQALAPGASTTCRADRLTADLAPGARTDTAKATARTTTQALNAAASATLQVPGPAARPRSRVAAAPEDPVARPDTVTTTVGHPVVVGILDNDLSGSTAAPLDATSVRLRLDPGLPTGSVLYGDVKSLVVPQTQPDLTRPYLGGGVFLVSGRGQITFVPIGYEPAPELSVGYQVSDALGHTARSTLTVTVGR